MEKKEYPPLLTSGIHVKTLDDIKAICVYNFVNTLRRMLIYEKFCEFLSILSQFHIWFEIWIDGSFVTEKEEPDDIDVVIFAKKTEINNLTAYYKNSFWLLISRDCKKLYLTDAYFATIEDYSSRSYWRGWFGFTREEKPKGMIKLEVNP